MKSKVNEVLPWQVLSSVSSLYPFWQLHSKLPTVFRQKWSQPPLLTKHSSISAKNEQQRFSSWQQKCSLWQQFSRSGQEYRQYTIYSDLQGGCCPCQEPGWLDVPSQTYLTRLTRTAMGWAVQEIEVFLSTGTNRWPKLRYFGVREHSGKLVCRWRALPDSRLQPAKDVTRFTLHRNYQNIRTHEKLK